MNVCACVCNCYSHFLNKVRSFKLVVEVDYECVCVSPMLHATKLSVISLIVIRCKRLFSV